MGIRLSRPSPAMVVALIALGVSLSGNAVAIKSSKYKIPKNSISAKHLKKGAVTRDKIGSGAVTTGAMAVGAVTSQTIAPGAVTSQTIADGGVTAADLGANSVTAPKVAEAAIGANAIAPQSLGTRHVDSFSGQVLQPGSLGAGMFSSQSVLSQLGGSTINGGLIGLGTLLGEQFAPGAIGKDQIGLGAIDKARIEDSAIDTSKIANTTPAVSATHSSAQSMAGLSAAGPLGTPVQFNSEAGLWDSRNMHNTNSNTSRFVATDPGVYSVDIRVVWAADPDGFRQLTLFKNATPITHTTVSPLRDADGTVRQTPHTLTHKVKLAAGDYLEVKALQSSAPCSPQPDCFTQALNIESGPSFSMSWELPG